MPEKVGKHQPAMMDAVERREIRCMYVIGENPAQSDADEHYHDELFGSLDLLVVQDIMMTKTARMADVVLPAAAFLVLCAAVAARHAWALPVAVLAGSIRALACSTTMSCVLGSTPVKTKR